MAPIHILAMACLLFAAGPRVSSEDAKEHEGGNQEAALKYYGYYWVDSGPHGNHLKEVVGHTNVQWVEGAAGLEKCAALGVQCILQVRWQFFNRRVGKGRNARTPLRDDYLLHWKRTAERIAPLIDHVEAFYMVDEPYWNGVSRKDLEKAIQTVKARFSDKPVMVVFAAPSLTSKMAVPANADWLGFDNYTSIDIVTRQLQVLKRKLHPHQRLFLVPQSFLNPAAPTDRRLAYRNRQYFKLARSEPLVIGLLNFGLFTSNQPAEIPRTFRVQRDFGRRLKIKLNQR